MVQCDTSTFSISCSKVRARGKHSSLFVSGVSDDEEKKSFYDSDTCLHRRSLPRVVAAVVAVAADDGGVVVVASGEAGKATRREKTFRSFSA